MDAPSPWDILEAARRAVPALDYALGVAGVAAAGVLIVGFLGKRRATVIILGGMLVAMVLVFAFSRLVAAESPSVVNAGIVLLWIVVAFFSIFLIFTVTAVAFGWPEAWARLLGFEAAASDSNPLEQFDSQISLTDRNSSESAIAALLGISAITPNANEREAIAKIFKTKLRPQPTRNYDQVARAVRRDLIQALIKLRKYTLREDFLDGSLRNSDLVGMDFRNVDARGIDFSKSFLLASDFRGADLRGANFSLTALRNAQFRNADLKGAIFAGADWFNATGLSIEQLQTIDSGGLRACPNDAGGSYSREHFVEFANKTYSVPFQQWGEEEQNEASKAWGEYARAGGLCEFAAKAQ